MAVTKYLNPNYSEGGSEPKYLSVPSLVAGGEEPDLSNYLAKDNTTEYTPSGDYNPATKKYVDDSKEIIIYDNLDALNVDREFVSSNIVNGNIKGILLKNISMPSGGVREYVLFFVTSVISNGMDIELQNILITNNNSGNSISIINLGSTYQQNYTLGFNTYTIGLKVVTDYNGTARITNQGTFVNTNNSDITKYIDENKLSINGVTSIYGDGIIYPIEWYNEETSSGAIRHLSGWNIKEGKLVHITVDESNENAYNKVEYKMPRYQVLTESEYSTLGTTPETDNVLYFVTPD